MKHIRFSGIVLAFSFGMFFLGIPFSAGQDAPDTPVAENAGAPKPVEPLTIKLSVEEVRLDVVAVDNRGRPVTDLKTADFEVFQNGRQQKILSSVYVKDQSDAAAQPSVSQKENRNITPLPTAALKKEDTRRTIIFVLDEGSMSFEDVYNAKMALRNFVEKQMQTGDMVAILTTGRGNSALQMFLSDKKQLLARINAIRITSPAPDPNPDDSHFYRIYDNQLFTLSYGIRALKDMPGRKILNMLTAETSVNVPTTRIMGAMGESPIERINFTNEYNGRFSRLAEDALRAGVVVNFLNIGGLKSHTRIQDVSVASWNSRDIDPNTPDPAASSPETLLKGDYYDNWNIRRMREPPAWVKENLEQAEKDRFENALDARNLVNPLPAKTGGVTIENSNFFLEGVGRDVDNLMKGYYLITYEPPPDTFSPGDKEVYHQIKVNVKRRNIQVHTRDGFYNRQESVAEAAAPAVHPLQNAIFSPFLYADLSVNTAAGYVRDSKAGYLIRSWIHLDPKDVKFVETDGGGARIDLETVCLTSDINGVIHDLMEAEYSFNIAPENKSENIAWIQKHGIRFAMLLPVKKPGSYYVRTAVQDKESGKVGSSYQFVEIPDLGRKRLAMSNIFMVTSTEDLNWLLSDATTGINEGLFFPVFRAEEVRSPALRTYALGDRLQTLAMIYNADEKAVAGAEIEMHSILYKDGEEFGRSTPRPVSPGSAGTLEGIPVSQTLTMGSDLLPGDYVMQLVITDKKNSKTQEGSATQTLSFTVVEK